MIRKIYCIKSNIYINFKNLKILYFFDETLVLSFNCNEGGSKDEKIFKEDESIEKLVLGLIKSMEECQCQMNK